MEDFKVGDRVRVGDDYFVAYLRGAVGTIAEKSDVVEAHTVGDTFWVEFDELLPDEDGALTEAGAFDGTELQLVQ